MRALARSLLILVACASPAAAQTPTAYDLDKLVAEHPLGEKQPVRIDEIDRTDSASVHLVQIAPGGEVPPNYHAAHEEMVLLWRGRGVLTVGGNTFEMKPGVWALIRRTVVHAFKNPGPEVAVLLAVFTPAFDGKDRVVVKPG